ncbi:MAG TPA: hypothetical protein VMS74_09765 [Acidimicrobiia bacterium]|nr:hypothetical protein [Acidimicrobiia bacterium]
MALARFRRSIEDLDRSQQVVLGLLAIAVMAVAGVAVVLAASGGSGREPAAGDATVTTAISTSTSSSTSTTAGSETTTTETTTTETTTTTTVPETTTIPSEPAPVLRADGIGDLAFGDDAARAFEALVSWFGVPDHDTGWVDQSENYGICLGETVRFVRWGSLQTFFSDGPTDWAPGGQRHFASYTQAVYFDGDEIELVTADGLALGSPVGDIRALYGDEAVYDDEIYGPVFVVDLPGPAQQWGPVTGLDPDDTIEAITGSYACGE